MLLDDRDIQVQNQDESIQADAAGCMAEPEQAPVQAPAQEHPQAEADATEQAEQAPAEADATEKAEQTPAEADATEKAEQTPMPAEPKRKRGRPRKAPPSDWEILEEISVAFKDAKVLRPDDYGLAMANGEWHRCRGEGQEDVNNPWDWSGAWFLIWGKYPKLIAYNFAGALCASRTYRQSYMTHAERREQERDTQRCREELLRKNKEDADKAATGAQNEWAQLRPLDGVCGYLAAKKLADTYGLRGTADCIRVPLRNETGEIRAIQTIAKEGDGFRKLFTKGCRMPGLFFEFPEDAGASGPIAIGEGLATVATVVDVLGWHGVAAMNCGNLDAVVGVVRRRYPDRTAVILADNDAYWNKDGGGTRPHRKGERRPEEDNSGVVKAKAAAQKHGVKVAVPPIVGNACTDFNDLFVRSGGGEAGAEAVRQAVEGAQYVPGCPPPAGYELRMEASPAGEPGLYAVKDGKVGPQTVRLGPPLIVEGHVRGAGGQEWGLLVSWADPDGTPHRACLSRADMASRDRTWLTTLVRGGYQADSGHAQDLLRFLELSNPGRRILCPSKTGWLDDGRDCFVLPSSVIGSPAGRDPADIVFAGQKSGMYTHAGTLNQWKQNVATLAVGNIKMEFCLCAAFAGPLLHIIGLKNVGFHIVGESSIGKTTHIQLANSVWDKWDKTGSWNSTDNGKEVEAYSRNDTLLCIDEINEANAKKIGQIIYMLGNGAGKTRSKKDGTLRDVKRFRLVFFSTGEVTLEALITGAGGIHMAGMDVRAVPVPLSRGNLTAFHGRGSSRGLCDAVQAGVTQFFGTAGPAFVAKLLDVLKDRDSKFQCLLKRENLAVISADIITTAGYDINEIDPQILRISETIALVCVAGMLAQEFGIIPEDISIKSSCINVLKDTIEQRGGTSSGEEAKVLEATSSFIFSNKDSAFIFVDETGKTAPTSSRPLAGFKRIINGVMHYYILPDALHKVWNGIAINTALKALEKNGYIKTSPRLHGRRYYQQCPTVPFDGNRRWMYCIVLPDPEDAPEDDDA